MALSISQGRFVAPKTNNGLSNVDFNPCISLKSCVLTLLSPPLSDPSPRLVATESISSIKIKLGAFNRATLNKELINFSLSPNHLLNKSAEDALKKVALHSVAAAFANSVFPHPGGPNSNIPDQGFLAPLNNCGFAIGKTMASLKACLTCSKPAMSSQFTFGDSVTIVPDMVSISSCSSEDITPDSESDVPISCASIGLALLSLTPPK